jgi:hypothetical protein
MIVSQKYQDLLQPNSRDRFSNLFWWEIGFGFTNYLCT